MFLLELCETELKESFPLLVEPLPIPADQPIMQIKNLEEVIIPTMEIKVKKTLVTPLTLY